MNKVGLISLVGVTALTAYWFGSQGGGSLLDEDPNNRRPFGQLESPTDTGSEDAQDESSRDGSRHMDHRSGQSTGLSTGVSIGDVKDQDLYDASLQELMAIGNESDDDRSGEPTKAQSRLNRIAVAHAKLLQNASDPDVVMVDTLRAMSVIQDLNARRLLSTQFGAKFPAKVVAFQEALGQEGISLSPPEQHTEGELTPVVEGQNLDHSEGAASVDHEEAQRMRGNPNTFINGEVQEGAVQVPVENVPVPLPEEE